MFVIVVVIFYCFFWEVETDNNRHLLWPVPLSTCDQALLAYIALDGRPERLLYKNGFCATSTFKQLYQEKSQEVKDLSNIASKSPFIISSPDFQLAK